MISLPASRFYKDAVALSAFLLFLVTNIENLDKIATVIVGLLAKVPEDQRVQAGMPTDVSQAVNDFAEGKASGPLENLSTHLPLLAELIFCRMVDNFLNYVSELMALIFETKPEMLKSDEKISIEEILEYPTREALLNALIERKVLALSFKGMIELNSDLARKIGFALFDDAADLKHAAILVEQRNLVTHNRGCVNRRYLERVSPTQLKLGDRLTFSIGPVKDDLAFLKRCLVHVDQRAQQKFCIPRNEPDPTV